MAQQSVSPQSGRSLTIGTEIPQTREKCIIEQKTQAGDRHFYKLESHDWHLQENESVTKNQLNSEKIPCMSENVQETCKNV